MENFDSNIHSLLEDYIQGALNEVDRIAVEKRLKEDVSFKEHYNFLRNVQLGLEEEAIQEYKNQAKSLIEKDRQAGNLKTSKTNNLWKWLLGLIAIGLLCFLVLKLMSKPKMHPKEFAQVYLEEKYKPPGVLRNTVSDEWQKSTEEYKMGNYTGFISAMKPLIENGEHTNEQILYYSLSHLYKTPRDCKTAAFYLQRLNNKNSGYLEVALWYKALALVDCQENEQAIQELKKLSSISNWKKHEVQDLLLTLEN